MKTYPVIVLLFLLAYFTEARCQTASDTAAVLTGTVLRGKPITDPVKPPPPERFEPAANKPVKKKTFTRKAEQAVFNASETATPNDQDTAILTAYRNSQIAYYRAIEKRNMNNKATNDSVSSYYLWALHNRQAIISRQQSTGNIIFILVVVLVLSGLLFSAIQFYIALRSVKKRSAVADTNTSFKASLSGIEVSSSVLGVIVLTISIAFFYLYLSRVYPLVSLDQIPVQLPSSK